MRVRRRLERLEKVLRARNIQGILLPPQFNAIGINWGGFRWGDFCIIRFGHSVSNPRAHLVTSDQLTDGMIAFENIWNKGYRRIAYVTTKSGGYLNVNVRSIRNGDWAGPETAITEEHRYGKPRLYVADQDFHTQPAWLRDGSGRYHRESCGTVAELKRASSFSMIGSPPRK